MLKKILFTVRLYLIRGKRDQTFLDAKWIQFLLRHTPKQFKRSVAMKILALSPHYFIGKKTDGKNYLEEEYKRNLTSRQLIFNHLLSENISSSSVVMDYGCGPGFLAKIVADKSKKVFALDISDGVLLCADTINHKDNIDYLNVFKNQAEAIEDNSIDLIYSFAVLQHVSEKLVDSIFELFHCKLKKGGKLMIQVQLQKDGLKTEQEWVNDNSLTGKLKYQYGLHVFSNSITFYKEKLEEHKLKFLSLTELKELFPDPFDDICQQQLITAQNN